MDFLHPYLWKLVSCLVKQQVCNICPGLVVIHGQVCSLSQQSARSCCVYSNSLPLPWLMINKTRLRSECVLAFVFRLMLGEESGFPWGGCLNIKVVTSQHQSRDPSAQHVRPLQPCKHAQSSSLSPVTTINKALLKRDRGMNNEPRCFIIWSAGPCRDCGMTGIVSFWMQICKDRLQREQRSKKNMIPYRKWYTDTYFCWQTRGISESIQSVFYILKMVIVVQLEQKQ